MTKLPSLCRTRRIANARRGRPTAASRYLVCLVGAVAFLVCAVTDARAEINLATGNLYERFADYAPRGAERLSFIRHYNSRAAPTYGPTAPLGALWRSDYERYLIFHPRAPVVKAERPDGKGLYFGIKNGVGVPDSDIDLTLVKIGENWVLTDQDGTEERYGAPDRTGRSQPLSIKAPDGYARTLTYNAANQLVSVSDTEGRTLTLAYDGDNLITVTTPDGLVLTYGYDSSGPAFHNDRLVSVSYSTDPEKNRTYVYENASFPHALTGIVDGKGNRLLTWTFDDLGRATSSERAGGVNLTIVSYDRDERGNPVNTVTNSRGERTVYKFAILQNMAKIAEIDRPATATTPAFTQRFTYDERGYLIKQSDSRGNVTNYWPKTQTQSP